MMKPAEQVDGMAVPGRTQSHHGSFSPQRKSASLPASSASVDEDAPTIEDLLPSPDAGPDALYARNLLLEALDDALDELPDDQREVFLAHEFEGRSFKELSEESGTSINTLLSRKRYAVLHLRERLQDFSNRLDGK